MKIDEVVRGRLAGKRDSFHLALSVEGGVMRGSITAGMIEALHALGLEKIFDSYWGSSIGAINAAYLASGETAGKSDLYAKASKYLYRRPHPVHGFIDLDWLFGVGFKEVEPLDFAKIDQKKLRFLVTKAGWWQADEAIGRYKPQKAEETKELLRGACQAPIVAGLPLGKNRGGLWDAALYENWPMATPLRKGVTHLLVLRSSSGKNFSPWQRAFYAANNWFFMTPSYREQEERLLTLKSSGLALEIKPEEDLLGLFEKDASRILEGALYGSDLLQQNMSQFLKQKPEQNKPRNLPEER